MAVVTYQVSVAGGVVTINPDPTQIMLVERDYVLFTRAPGTAANIKVKVLGGPNNGEKGEIIIAVRGTDTRLFVADPPAIEADGSVLITFTDGGGGNDGFPPG